jgi:tripartite-type tricarboxylate transporter receptor subunit TctC
MIGIGRRRFIMGAAGLVAASGPLGSRAFAQADYPNRPIRFIVTLAAGGGLDFVARICADAMSRDMGQQVYVENRTGAGGTIGTDAAIKSPPDGYSVLVTNDNLVSSPFVLGLDVDFLKQLTPVSQIGRQPQALAVHPKLGVSTIGELVELLKKQPGTACATSGVGSQQHIMLEWFAKTVGVKLQHTPYRGAGQAINDLVAGHVPMGFLGPTAVLPHFQAGVLKVVAQTGEERSKTMPDAPTLIESGYAGLWLESWYGAFLPLGTPAPIVEKLNAAFHKALNAPGTIDAFFKAATASTPTTPEELVRLARVDAEKYGRLVKELNIRAG